MRWRDARQSSNVEDGGSGGFGLGGGGGGFKLGLGGMAAVVVISLLLGKNPLEMLSLVNSVAGGGGIPMQAANPRPPANTANDETQQFVAAILGETEDVWSALFTQAGQTYPAPKLVLFAGSIRTACGGATSASGPFYCPSDRKVYLDTSFFNDMQQKLGGGGDFAYAYVIAHEVGHHVQNLMGNIECIHSARQRGENVEGDGGLQVRLELQADCFAGLWAHQAQARHQWLEAGDMEEALSTASAIGDDRLQKQSQGEVVPDAFTHGTAQQRVRWFKTGYDSGDVRQCDTFAADKV